MPDKKLTDSEIVKALEKEIHLAEYVDSDYCSNTEVSVLKSALDLINRLQEQKQNLEIELKAMRGAANSYKAEIERLKKFALIRAFDRFEKEIKAEAYKEFVE